MCSSAARHFGISAKVARPEDRAVYAYMMARLYARSNDVEHCLAQLRRAMENGYPNMKDVYENKEFATVRQDPRFAELMQAAPVIEFPGMRVALMPQAWHAPFSAIRSTPRVCLKSSKAWQ